MGTIRKIGEDYFIEFYARGLKYQQKAGPDRCAAEKLLKETEAKIQQGEMGIMIRNVGLDIFCEDFLNEIKRDHTPETFLRYQEILKDFRIFLKNVFSSVDKLSQLTPRIIEEYKDLLSRDSFERTPASINLTLLLLSDFFQYGIKLGYIHDDPVSHIQFLSLEKEEPFNVLPQEDRERFLELVKNQMQLHVELQKALPQKRQQIEDTLAVCLLQRGVRLSALYQILNFSDIIKTRRYVSLRCQYLRQLSGGSSL